MQRSVKNISICSFTFLLLLILTGIATAAPVDSGQKVIVPLFNDVSSSDANAIYINYMAKRGLISGFPDGSFHPTEGLTRAQAATLLCLVKGLDATNTVQSGFSDIHSNHWAAGYINAASQAGYITGFPDNTYQPEAVLTRAQGISLFLRLSSDLDASLDFPSLDDMDKSHWAASSMANALAAGMISKDGNKIYPEQSFARGDLVKALSILITKDPGLNQTVLNGKLKVKSGDVRLKRAGNDETQSTTSTSIVKAGDTITTGKDGEAEIIYPDGSGILLKCNSELIIKSAKGRTYIKSDGTSGTAVDDLELELKNGTIFGALASKYTSSKEENKTASIDRYKLLASRDKNFDLVAAKKETEPWYKTAEKKKVKVKVDMPWGVAAVRGTFWSNTVSSTYCGMTILIGDGDLSSAGQTQTLSPGQSSGINRQGNPPSPPGPMSPSEAGEWSRQRGWVLERGGDIQNNRGLGEHGDNHDGLGDESDNKLGELQTTLNNALNQTLNRVKQIPTAISSGGGNSGVGGSGSVITRVAAPVANVLSGIYSQPLNISLSSATEGATIYFTTDGSDPKTSSTREIFSTLLNINVNTTIKAYATKPGMTDSDIATFVYTINLPLPLQVDAPTASPTAGTYSESVNISLSSATRGSTIYYTTDGSDPKTSNTLAPYSTPVNIVETTTIKAYATKDGMSDSDVVSFDYTINSLPPNVTLRLLDLQRISVNVNGDETTAKPGYVAHSAEPSVSADGHYVAFYSYANNLVQGDTNNGEDVFVKDTKDGTVVRVSVTSTGGQSNGGATNMPRITPDGRYVVFRSGSTNLATGNPADDTNTNWDIFVHDRDTDENGLYDEADGFKTIRVSISSTGEQTTHSNFGNCNPSISDNGRFICFSTDATNLVVEGTNGKDHIYVHDRDADEDNIFDEAGAITTRRVSVSSSGDEADTDCYAPEISGNGRYVVFASGATTLVPGISTFGIYLHDLQTGTTSWLTEGTHPQISYDGNYIAFESGNNVYCLERSTGNIQCVSLSISGEEPDKYSHQSQRALYNVLLRCH